MSKVARIVIILIVVAAISGIAYYFLQQSQAAQEPLTASGTMEATEVEVSAQTAARITSVPAQEGVPVKKDAVLARLDRALLQDQAKQAKAGITAALAAVKATKDDGTDADIAAAKA